MKNSVNITGMRSFIPCLYLHHIPFDKISFHLMTEVDDISLHVEYEVISITRIMNLTITIVHSKLKNNYRSVVNVEKINVEYRI